MKNACTFAWQPRRCFKLKLHSVRSFPCVWSRTRSERAESTGRSNSMIRSPVRSLFVTLSVVLNAKKSLVPSSFVYTQSINCRLSVEALLRAKKKKRLRQWTVHRREKRIGWIIFLEDDRSTVMQITQFPSRESRNCSRSWNAINRGNPLSRGRWVIRFLSPLVGRKKRPRIVRDFRT